MVEITDLHAADLAEFSQFDNHVMVRVFHDPTTNLQGVIALHRGSDDRPAFGATRFAHYPAVDAAIAESLTLAKLMSYKSALAGLPYGGAKAVIMMPEGEFDRTALLHAYAEVVNTLDGRFVTGADLGISPDDVEVMKEVSPHMVGIHNDPVYFTALGLFEAIEQTTKEVWGDDQVVERSFAIQGLGKIGEGLLHMIYPFTQEITVTDINPDRIDQVLKAFPGIRAVDPKQIYHQPVDFFCPCAHGGIINQETVSQLACKVVEGGANSQLQTDQMGDALFERGIVYVPDYVVNAGGLISVVDEFRYGNGDVERVLKDVMQIPQTVARLFREGKKQDQPLHRVANQQAEEIFSKYE